MTSKNQNYQTNSIQSDLYPPIEPYITHRLQVSTTHNLYIEESGNPNGIPVIFLHGGPGGGTNPDQRRFFDPEHYRIILFDQRGCGHSTPHGEVTENTPDALIADIEKIRQHLGIKSWHVFGGSWGSTLALIYAQAHPESCLSLTLRGIFLMRQFEIDWFLYGMQHTFPEAAELFKNFIPENERKDLLQAYYNRLIDPDPAIHMPAARSWARYEASCAFLLPRAAKTDDVHDLAIARLEAHYMLNCRFNPDDRILKDINKISHLPIVIVQGRFDIVCPPISAYELAQTLPSAKLEIIPDAGHAAMEPGTRSALVRAMEGHKSIKTNPSITQNPKPYP